MVVVASLLVPVAVVNMWVMGDGERSGERGLGEI